MSFLYLWNRVPLNKLVDNLRASYDAQILHPFHNRPSLVTTLSPMNPFHAVILLFKIHFNSIIHSAPRYLRLSHFFRFSCHGFELIYGIMFTTCHVHHIDLISLANDINE
jgi:hypothetical protein